MFTNIKLKILSVEHEHGVSLKQEFWVLIHPEKEKLLKEISLPGP